MIVLAIVVLVVVVLVGVLIGYIIYLQRKNTDYKGKNSELETEMKYYDECKEQENIYNDRLDNITHKLDNCSNALLSCSNSSNDLCTDLRSNYTDIFNKYILLVEKDSELKNELKEIKDNYDELQTNHSLLQQKYDSITDNNSSTNECRELKNEKIEDLAKIEYIGNQNTFSMKENAEKLTSIKSLKNENINMYSKYMNLRIIYELESKINKLNIIEQKHFIQNIQELLLVQSQTKNSVM